MPRLGAHVPASSLRTFSSIFPGSFLGAETREGEEEGEGAGEGKEGKRTYLKLISFQWF